MKGITALLAACSLCIGAAQAATVTLTRNDVSSAQDIEAAINTATSSGTTPGKVVLDGRNGGFTYTGSDRVINLAVSNLALVGINGATLEDCNGGGAILFDPVPVANILIQNLTLNCESGGIFVTDLSQRRNITIRDNRINSFGAGIFLINLVDSKISNNILDAGDSNVSAVVLRGARNTEVIGNTMTNLGADAGIFLGTEASLNSTGNTIVANRISAQLEGIQLSGSATRNSVALNHISLGAAGATGIFLDTGTSNNRVQFNRVASAVGGAFTTVLDLGTDNRVSGNRP